MHLAILSQLPCVPSAWAPTARLRRLLAAAAAVGGLVASSPGWAAPEDKGDAPVKPPAGSTAPGSGGRLAPRSERPVPPVPIDRNRPLRGGDVIEVYVEDFPDLTRKVRLYKDGSFEYPYGPDVEAAGKTTKQLMELLVTRLKSQIRRPTVVVSLVEPYMEPSNEPPAPTVPRITVLGAVLRKGEVELPKPKPLRTVLAEAGPLVSADLSTVRVRDAKGMERRADFSSFLRDGKIRTDGQAEGDILLEGGEEILVLARATAVKPEPVRVEVLGKLVAKPGTFEAEQGTTILQVLERVGVLPGADRERVQVTGPNHTKPRIVNVAKYASGDTASGYTVQDGDQITVPEKPLRVLVVGEVQHQGEIAIDKGDTLLKVLIAAGMGPSSDQAKIELIRENAQGKADRKTINVRDIARRTKKDEELQAGDVLIVPNRKQKRSVLEYFSYITAPFFLFRSF
jgi:protein involved in polysaccharide export with SLBB domain